MSQSCVGLGQRLHTSPELGLARDVLGDGRSFCDMAWRVTRSVGDMLFSSDGEQFDCRGEIGQSSKLAIVGGDRMIEQQSVCWMGIEPRSDGCVCWYF